MLTQPSFQPRPELANLAMAAQHLNAPTGRVVTEADLARALRRGTAHDLSSPDAAAAIAFLFVEINPSLISACAHEAGGSFASANALYLETLEQCLPRVLEWEQAVEHLL